MESERCCVIHFSSAKSDCESLLPLTSDKASRINEVAPRWLPTNKEPECTIAAQITVNCVKEGDSYHRSCYLKFASESKVARANCTDRK